MVMGCWFWHDWRVVGALHARRDDAAVTVRQYRCSRCKETKTDDAWSALYGTWVIHPDTGELITETEARHAGGELVQDVRTASK